jgi:uncharacterized Ntn-hydrolase superfamily protein
MRACLVLFLIACGCASPRASAPRPVATFSVVGYDPKTGELGVAVQSKFFGVGSVVPWAKAGVGAVATQAWANVKYGPEGLEHLQAGKTAQETVAALTGADSGRDRRQLGIVDAKGRSASFTGRSCIDWAGHRVGRHYCAQGNILAGEQVVGAMAEAFERARDREGTELADWLMAALQAGQKAGGDRRGQQSAALLVMRAGGGYMGGNDRFIDLRVEDHPQPIQELARLLAIHKSLRKYLKPR